MSVTDNEEALNRKLYEKVSAEMEAYENELLAMPPEEILEHAYAYATKQDIVLALEEHDLSEKQARALLRCDNALETIFDRWEGTPESLVPDFAWTKVPKQDICLPEGLF